MSHLSLILPLLLAFSADPVGRVETEGVRVETIVSSQMYLWQVTNTGDAPPIESVSIVTPLTYDLTVPDGWEYDYRDSLFHAWTDRLDRAIHPGRTLRFQGRSTSAGGPMTRTEMILGTSQSPDAITVAGVYAPGPRSRGLVLTIALTIAAIGIIQAMIVSRQRRTASSAGK